MKLLIFDLFRFIRPDTSSNYFSFSVFCSCFMHPLIGCYIFQDSFYKWYVVWKWNERREHPLLCSCSCEEHFQSGFLAAELPLYLNIGQIRDEIKDRFLNSFVSHCGVSRNPLQVEHDHWHIFMFSIVLHTSGGNVHMLKNFTHACMRIRVRTFCTLFNSSTHGAIMSLPCQSVFLFSCWNVCFWTLFKSIKN